MAHSTTKARRSLWPFGIVATGSVTYFLTLLLVLYVLDRLVLNSQKLEIIRENYHTLVVDLTDEFTDSARTALFAPSAPERESARHYVQKALDDIVKGPSCMYHMELHDESGATVVAADASTKVKRFNTWRNTLFLQNFRGVMSFRVSRQRNSPDRGLLVGYYTTPLNYAPIERLAAKYRIIAVLLVALWAAVYSFIYRNLFRPVRNVTAFLERSREAPPRLIHKPSAPLENAYNQLATRALLQLMEERLSSAMQPGLENDTGARTHALSSAVQLARKAFDVKRMAVAELSTANDQISAVEEYEETTPSAELQAIFQQALGRGLIHEIDPEGRFTIQPGESAFTYVAPLAPNTCLLVWGELREKKQDPNQVENLRRACTVLRRGLLAYRAYREGIFRQRSEANIVLSRNLGHDLTNIIATSKLDLMAVRRLLESSTKPGGLNAPREELLRQSVNGLLENTKFLQEIVNIYRSFSHVKRPQYERRELRQLIEEFLAAFEPSVSARTTITRELHESMPAPIVEPRLLKLALFNVLTNALDALRRAQVDEVQPQICVRARFDESSGEYRIEIDDNGPGIRDAQGRLLSAGELQAIFDYGYSTKSEAGEGLGLSWVRTILADFHDGAVSAENLPGGGARIALLLRSMERSEAKVGQPDPTPTQS